MCVDIYTHSAWGMGSSQARQPNRVMAWIVCSLTQSPLGIRNRQILFLNRSGKFGRKLCRRTHGDAITSNLYVLLLLLLLLLIDNARRTTTCARVQFSLTIFRGNPC